MGLKKFWTEHRNKSKLSRFLHKSFYGELDKNSYSNNQYLIDNLFRDKEILELVNEPEKGAIRTFNNLLAKPDLQQIISLSPRQLIKTHILLKAAKQGEFDHYLEKITEMNTDCEGTVGFGPKGRLIINSVDQKPHITTFHAYPSVNINAQSQLQKRLIKCLNDANMFGESHNLAATATLSGTYNFTYFSAETELNQEKKKAIINLGEYC